jgi:ABC-type sugar transport system ATPase subunit
MDQAVRSTLRARIRHIHDELEATTIYVTHDQEEAVALADRIIVMNMGTIQQVGMVNEIFDYPSNQFVAGFVGDPEMNFLDGKLEEENQVVVVGNDGHTSWPISKPLTQAATGQDVTIGVRPEKINISTESADSALQTTVELIEFVGDYKLITFQIADRTLKALTPISFSATENGNIWVSADPAQMHIFDKGSGTSLIQKS